MWAFLGSDCMFFGSLIATYLAYKGKSITGPYPEDVFSIPVTSVSTFVLLMSSNEHGAGLLGPDQGQPQGLPHLGALHSHPGDDLPGVPDLRGSGTSPSTG